MNFPHTGLIFDGDDTLWLTQPLYERAKQSFFRVMEAEGFDPSEAKSRLNVIEITNARLLGFSKHRFPKSMADTYRALCKAQSKRADKSIALLVESIGNTVFEGSPQIFNGVYEVLTKLRALNVLLILATKGDPEIQKLKISSSGLKNYFHFSYILENKGADELMQIVQASGIDVQDSWSIGNSIRSDINPAIRIGMRAIWIPHYTWDFEDEEPLNSERLFRANTIKEVGDIVIKTLGVEA